MYNKDTITFRQIVLEHIKRILEISSNEFTGGYTRRVEKGNSYVEEYVPDTRASYIQSVESLHDVLEPHFDKLMIEQSKEYDKNVEEEYSKAKKEHNEGDGKWIEFWRIKKQKISRTLFRQLNALLKRNSYLETSVFGEDRDEIAKSE